MEKVNNNNNINTNTFDDKRKTFSQNYFNYLRSYIDNDVYKERVSNIEKATSSTTTKLEKIIKNEEMKITNKRATLNDKIKTQSAKKKSKQIS